MYRTHEFGICKLRPIAFYEGNSPITTDMNIAASGTLFLDLDGEQLELAKGSGLFAAANSDYLWPSETQITVYYVLHDGRTPITKSAARAASLKPIGSNAVIKTPNRSGGQVEG